MVEYIYDTRCRHFCCKQVGAPTVSSAVIWGSNELEDCWCQRRVKVFISHLAYFELFFIFELFCVIVLHCVTVQCDTRHGCHTFDIWHT
jgi:hypothetical protein